jgi:hypothetical protein
MRIFDTTRNKTGSAVSTSLQPPGRYMISLNRKACLLLATITGESISYAAFADSPHQRHDMAGLKALTPEATAFHAENEASMEKMMADMQVKPSDDIDRDFVAMEALISFMNLLATFGHATVMSIAGGQFGFHQECRS